MNSVPTRVGDLVEVVKTRVGGERPVVLSVSEKAGIVPQSSLFKKQIAVSNLDKYVSVLPGDIVYNPYLLWNRAVGCWFGSEPGCASPAYQVLRPRDGGTARFLHYFFRSEPFRFAVDGIASGSVTRRRVAPLPDVLDLVFVLPPLDEQRRIAGVLGALDDFIDTNQRLIASLTGLALAYASVSGASSAARVSLRDLYEVGLSGVWGEDSPNGQQVERAAVLRGKDLEEMIEGEVADPPYRFLSAKQVACRMPKVGEIWTAGSGSLGPSIPVTQDLSGIVGWPTVLYSNFVKRLVPTEDSDWYGVAWAAIVRAWRSGAFSDFVTGTAMPNLDPDAMLRGISVPALDPDARAEVNRLVELAFRSELREEVVKLRRTRDELLPLLLSGRVSVREVAA